MIELENTIGSYEIDALIEVFKDKGLDGVIREYPTHIILRHLQQRGVVSEDREKCIQQLKAHTDLKTSEIVCLVDETKRLSFMLPEYTLKQNQRLDRERAVYDNHTHMEWVDGKLVGIIPNKEYSEFHILDLTNNNEIKLGVVLGENLSINWNSNWLIGNNLLRWTTHKVREIRKMKEQGVFL